MWAVFAERVLIARREDLIVPEQRSHVWYWHGAVSHPLAQAVRRFVEVSSVRFVIFGEITQRCCNNQKPKMFASYMDSTENGTNGVLLEGVQSF